MGAGQRPAVNTKPLTTRGSRPRSGRHPCVHGGPGSGKSDVPQMRPPRWERTRGGSDQGEMGGAGRPQPAAAPPAPTCPPPGRVSFGLLGLARPWTGPRVPPGGPSTSCPPLPSPSQVPPLFSGGGHTGRRGRFTGVRSEDKALKGEDCGPDLGGGRGASVKAAASDQDPWVGNWRHPPAGDTGF